MPQPTKELNMAWSANQYLAFEDERTRPSRDLLAHVPATGVRRAIDIGCGPGNSTQLLAERYPQAKVAGIDSSTDMIAAARKRLPDVAFEVADIESWSPSESYDLIFANAVLQWVHHHETLFPALASRLAPGGTLAIQVPDNLNEAAHSLMREVAADGPWAGKLAAAAASRIRIASVREYYEMLRPVCTRIDIWRTTYHHPLSGGASAVVEWFKGSGLRPFLEPLQGDERAGYLDRYTAAVEKAYPAQSDGIVLLPFPRLFIVATRAAG